MNIAVTLVLLVFATFLQAVLPVVKSLGYASFPILLAVVVFYALTHKRGTALRIAFVAGLLQDSLSLTPLGFSSFCFCVAVLFVNRFKEEVFINDWVTHILFGAVVNGGVVLVMYILLSQTEEVILPFLYFSLKWVGALLLGGLVVPVVYYVVDLLYRKLDVEYVDVTV